MKSFVEYLTESKKTFQFKVRIANCGDDKFDAIETALKQFDLISMSKIKNHPPEDRSLEFPKVGICEVKDFDVELNYPTTDISVRTAVAHATDLKLDQVMAYTKEGFEQRMRDIDSVKKVKKGESVLNKTDLEAEPKPKLDLSMIKSLETRKYEFDAQSNETGKTTNDLPQNNNSPIGSVKRQKK
jgi:hypothetical protein